MEPLKINKLCFRQGKGQNLRHNNDLNDANKKGNLGSIKREELEGAGERGEGRKKGDRVNKLKS